MGLLIENQLTPPLFSVSLCVKQLFVFLFIFFASSCNCLSFRLTMESGMLMVNINISSLSGYIGKPGRIRKRVSTARSLKSDTKSSILVLN